MTNLVKYNAARTALAEAHAIEKLPNLPGVYAFYKGDDCMYVGESKSIRKRIATHERKRQLAGCDVRFFVCADRKDIEAWLIKELKPKKNGRSVERENLMNSAASRFIDRPDILGFDAVFGNLFCGRGA